MIILSAVAMASDRISLSWTEGGAVGVAVSGLLIFVADLASLLSLVRIG